MFCSFVFRDMRRAGWTRGELKPSEELEGKAKRGGGSDKALYFNIQGGPKKSEKRKNHITRIECCGARFYHGRDLEALDPV